MIRAALTIYLRELTGPATEQVQRQPLPSDTPPMLHDVLQEKQALGSVSTFVCGRVVLAWMGDFRLRLWQSDDIHAADLRDDFETSQRRSTRRGPVGGDPDGAHVRRGTTVAPPDSAGCAGRRMTCRGSGVRLLRTTAMPFQPPVNQELAAADETYRVAEHPAAPEIPYGQGGR